MSEKDTGGPAFPWTADREDRGDMPGMTMRDWFAGRAMQGLIVGTKMWRDDEDDSGVATCAYAIADAMLRERAK